MPSTPSIDSLGSAGELSLPPGMQAEALLVDRGEVRVLRAKRGGRRIHLRLDARRGGGEVKSELAVLATLSHPGIASLVAFGALPGGGTYLAREWVEGQDLLTWSQSRDAEAIGRQVAALTPALASLHGAGFVHGDIKPENIIIDAEGRPVLTDFGLASARVGHASDHGGGEAAGVEGDGGASGSLFALAPELLAGAAPSPATDLFALGALLHQLLARERRSARDFYALFPLRSFLDAAGSHPEDLPPWSRDVVVALLSRDPERRPRSATEVGQLLSGRLGVELETPTDIPPSWPMSLGREGWLRRWIEDGLLGAGSAQSSAQPTAGMTPSGAGSPAQGTDSDALACGPLWWLRLPEGEDLAAFANTLRVNVALHGLPGVMVDLGDLSAPMRSTRALTDWSRSLFETSPAWLLLVLEDHQHGQQRALEAVLVARSTRAPMTPLVVLAKHPAPCHAEETWLIDAVPAVDANSVRRHLGKLLKEEDPGRVDVLAAALFAASGGAAARLTALLRALMRGGWLHGTNAGLRLRKGELPDLLSLAASGARSSEIEALERAELSVLARVAVAGGTEAIENMQLAFDNSEQDPGARSIAHLVTLGLIRMVPGQGGTVLRLAGAGLRENLPTDILREAHARRLEQLERMNRDEAAQAAHRLALTVDETHQRSLCKQCEALRESGSPEKALDLIGAALAAVLDTAQPGEEEPRALLPSLFLERAKCWIELGWHDRALAELERLEPFLDRRWSAQALVVRARIARTREDTEGALELLSKAEALAPEAATEAMVFRIQVLHSLGKDAEVRAAYRSLVGSGAPPMPERQRNYLASIDAVSAYRMGAVEEAEQLTRALLCDVRNSGDRNREAGLLVNLSTIARRTGHHSQALEALEQARSIYDELGDAAGIALAGANLGQLLRDDGELTRATTVLRDALTMREGLGDREGAATLRGILGLTLAERGHARTAIETLREARKSLVGAHRARFVPLLAAREREMRARIGDLDSTQTEALLPSSTTPDPRVLLSSAKTAFLAGDAQMAETLGQRALDLARSLSLEPNIQAAIHFLAAVRQDRTGAQPDARADRLTRESAQVLAILSSPPSHFDQAAARTMAESLGERGRNDLAARLWLALAARAADSERSNEDRLEAEKHLALCGAGLTEEEARHLRRALLGIPDPWAGDLLPRPQPTSTEDELEMRALDLLEINHQLLRQNDLNALLPQIVEKALMVTGAERGFLVLEEDGKLRQETALDSLHGDMAEPERELSRSVVQEALARMETICVSNAVDDPLLGGATSVISLELRSILCAPFVVEERLRGVIYVDHRLRTGAFGEGAERLCKLLADQAALAILQLRRRERIIELNRELERKVAIQREDLRSAQLEAGRTIKGELEQGLLGDSKAMISLRALLRRAAATDIAVLLQGESGTGKDLAAGAIHELSPRKGNPFIAENCAALPASLIEAELFGYAKGAFTGADGEREGLIERANGGTLFLDEIGEMSLELQSKLLRVLEQREVRRLGEAVPRPVDFRLVVATNRELELEIQAGRFREDLYYRLNGISIRMPRLEEHLEDVPALVEHFLRLESTRSGEPRTMARAVMAALCRRTWPGNVRELRNEVARLCVLSPGHISDPGLIRKAAASSAGQEDGDAAAGLFGSEVVPMRDLERRAIMHALERTGGDKSQAAKLLGLSRGTIYSRLKEYRSEEGPGE